ncbi:MAG: sugar phosphate isomerase/epimerase [Kiritimatiellae bacterium]|nr:sugar phosphate isomerase/epimerase [Kiritimatiellia bacterium]
MTRRTFMTTLAAAGLARAASAEPAKPKFLFGACQGLDKAAKMKAAGFDFIELGVGGTLRPNDSDEAFKPQLDKLLASPLPIRSCNGFLPKDLKLTGPNPLHEKALDYAEKACRRADLINMTCIVFGSGGARNAPKDFDIAKAKDQFIDFCRKLGDRIADCKVTVVLEPLNKKEANYLQTVLEGSEMVDIIDKPRIRLLGDFYHMRCENEPADDFRKAGAKIRHCHIAEHKGRVCPGTNGEDFSDYFAALRDIGYTGGVSCECGWPQKKNEDGSHTPPIEELWAKALETMRRQSGVTK